MLKSMTGLFGNLLMDLTDELDVDNYDACEVYSYLIEELDDYIYIPLGIV